MSDVIVDLAARRQSISPEFPVKHPAGVTLPLENPTDAALITSELRDQIRCGAYSADLVRRLQDTVRPGDRILVIGAGLGVVSTLVARMDGVDRVIAAEPNTMLCRYLDRVHACNGIAEVETANAMLAVGKRGEIPFEVHQDPRTAALAPRDPALMEPAPVPLMDLNLVLSEERISLIVCDTPAAPAELLAQADLAKVDRILLNCGCSIAECRGEEGICTRLAAQGFDAEPRGATMLLRRPATCQAYADTFGTPANTNSAPRLANLG
jgi:FkbM family methyltransferase